MSADTQRSRTSRTRVRRRRDVRRPAGPMLLDGGGCVPVPAGGLRQELDWEVIPVPGGPRYVARRIPSAELLLPAADGAQTGGGGVLVLDTHLLGLAAVTAWPLWSWLCPGRRLPVPVAGWWRQVPAAPTLTSAGVQHLWWPAQPGTPGAVPAVEWAVPERPADRDDLTGGERRASGTHSDQIGHDEQAVSGGGRR